MLRKIWSPIGTVLFAGLFLSLCTHSIAGEVGPSDLDLMPTSWSDRKEIDATLTVFGVEKPTAVGSSGAIAGTTGTSAVRAGLEALQQGGTAVDAVVTTALTQIALSAGSWVSYAGIFNLVYYEAESGEVYSLNAGFNTVLGENDPASIPKSEKFGGDGTPSGRTALVPGFFAGTEAAHDRFGKLPWSSLFDPAIHYAEEGFVLSEMHDSMLKKRKATLSRLEETKAVFTGSDGEFLGGGDVLRQPDLAKTLKAVAEQGSEYIYNGVWADRFVAAVRRDGGHMTLEDLQSYEPTWQEPTRTTHAGYDVVGPGLPGFGGAMVVEALNVMEAADLPAMGYPTESPEAFFWLTQISQLWATPFVHPSLRSFLLGGLDASIPSRLDKASAAAVWEKLEAGKIALATAPKTVDPKHSDAIVAVDAFGNVAAVVHTINATTWGETGIFVDGISIPDAASFQQAQIEEAGPGNRLPDPTTPLIVLRDGKPVLALSSIGAGLHQKTLTVLLTMLDHGLDLESAINSPSHHLPEFGAMGKATQQVIEGEFADEVLEAVRAMGLKIKEIPDGIDSRAPRGYVIGLAIDPEGTRRAVTTKMFNGAAMAH
ncbi:MAG: hypothetical protein HKN21_17325 [Candidatus Eisenbacteria bacterium]|uniref:Gamma-glutamyltransferase n=1 Tax=Eiseniibacteriota bacterium TaxID=2212470 RepID=A0A7Y2H475_UNCEI|nr:hypothetical protein [Candidatus Eisenbacteria bacterium]